MSGTADGKNCLTSYCTNTGHVNFVKVYCNSTDSSVRGLCGKHGFIDCINNENLTYCYSSDDSTICHSKNVDIKISAHDEFLK